MLIGSHVKSISVHGSFESFNYQPMRDQYDILDKCFPLFSKAHKYIDEGNLISFYYSSQCLGIISVSYTESFGFCRYVLKFDQSFASFIDCYYNLAYAD